MEPLSGRFACHYSMNDATVKKRIFEIDVYRGLAIVMMVIFHMMYDLNNYHYTSIPLYSHAFWKVYREIISFLFLGLAGFCLYQEHHRGIKWKNILKREIRLLLAALAVSAGTFLYAPSSPVWFGILHFIAAASIVALGFLNKKRLCFILGVLLLATGYIGLIHESRYRIAGFEWLGFGAAALDTLEIFPFIPFFGYILCGMGIAQTTSLKNDSYYFFLIPQNFLTRFLALCGNYSLSIYMVHQLVLVGIISTLRNGVTLFFLK